MRILTFILVFISSAVAAEIEHSKWLPHKNYVPTKELTKAFQVAREYYVNNLASSSDMIDYEYHAYSVSGGYIVSINDLYRVKEGGYAVAVDGKKCIYLSKSYKIKGARQCMAAGSDPLAG